MPLTNPTDAMVGESIATYAKYKEAVAASNFNIVRSVAVTLPHVISRPRTFAGKGTYLEFEGVTYPKSFRGEHKSDTWAYDLIYAQSEYTSLTALTALINSAFDSADARLIVRRPKPVGFEYDVIEVHSYVETPQGGGIHQLSFTATRVDSS